MTTLRDQEGSKMERHQGVKNGPSLTPSSRDTNSKYAISISPSGPIARTLDLDPSNRSRLVDSLRLNYRLRWPIAMYEAAREALEMGHRILVVEDSAVIRRLIEVCLRAGDVEIITREDGPGALEAVTTESPDLVVLDIGLPGMNGWQVLDAIRSQPATRHLPVVVLTAHAEEESRRRADEAGADAFITKPFQPNDFRETVLDLIR